MHALAFPLPAMLVALLLATPRANADTPPGWHLAGSRPQHYATGVVSDPARGGRSAWLAASVARPEGFGTLMQTISPESYRGKRLRVSADVKAENVGGWAGLWMRIDGADGRPLALDNMQARALRGSGEWQRHSIVLDVPPDSGAIAFGVLLHGEGRVIVDDFRFEVVDASVPVTATPQGRELPQAAVNPEFEE